MSEEYTQVNVRITKEQKEKWESAVDGHPVFSDLSSFIRHCVEEEIDREGLNE